jgi:hypothetical protein
MTILKWLTSGFLVVVVPYGTTLAGQGAWGPWSNPNMPSAVADAFVEDDGGALIIACNTTNKLISYILKEPRANWQKGTKIKITTRADDGSETTSTGYVIDPTALAVTEQLTSDISAIGISTMGKATTSFGMGDGVYARIFPAVNFRKSMEPVLQACGNHW